MQNGIPLTDEMQLQLAERYGGVEAWGDEMMAPHYSAAWAWAGNTPFKWGKQVASHLGGTRNPLVAHWPETVKGSGAPAGRNSPTSSTSLRRSSRSRESRSRSHVDGIEQQPMHGVTFADSLTDESAPERHTQQYFETIGNRAMYKDGWWLAVKTEPHPVGADAGGIGALQARNLEPGRRPRRALLPARRLQPGEGPRRQSTPRRCEELKDLFWQEAEKYNVLPLMARSRRLLRNRRRRFRRSPSTSSANGVRKHPLGNDPADLQPLVLDQRRPRDPGRRRRRGNRRRGRPPGRVLALRRRAASSRTPTR